MHFIINQAIANYDFMNSPFPDLAQMTHELWLTSKVIFDYISIRYEIIY